MHVSPAKHSYASVTDGQTDRQTNRLTDGQSDPYVSLCFAGDTKRTLVMNLVFKCCTQGQQHWPWGHLKVIFWLWSVSEVAVKVTKSLPCCHLEVFFSLTLVSFKNLQPKSQNHWFCCHLKGFFQLWSISNFKWLHSRSQCYWLWRHLKGFFEFGQFKGCAVKVTMLLSQPWCHWKCFINVVWMI